MATKDLDDLDLSNLIASPSQAMHIENPQQLLPMASIPTQYGETNQLSASIFDYPDNGDAATATEAILEELAATNGVEWSVSFLLYLLLETFLTVGAGLQFHLSSCMI